MVDPPEDQPSTPEEGAEGGGVQATPFQIVVNAQYIKDLSFENPRAPASLMASKEQPQINVDVNVNARKLQEPTYEVALTVRVEAKVGGEVGFIAELVYGGVFTLADMPDETLRPVLLIECPRLLFPFARRVIADVTRDGGFPPLLINPIDFAELYRRQFALEEQAPAGEA
jgi:preprotein translocase subunit SecB